jgi:enoyl-CoA hydratase
MNETEPVLAEDVDIAGAGTRWLTINRPEARNPLDSTTIFMLRDQVKDAVERGMRAVVVTGAGEHFSAGGDLKGYVEMYDDEEAFSAFLLAFTDLCHLLERSPIISIALVNGTCVAGGLELALAADLVIVAAEARVGDGHLKFAQLPGAGGSQRLTRAIAPSAAKVWLLSGDLFSAEQCVSLGLAVESVPRTQLRACAERWVERLSKHSRLAYGTMKQLIGTAFEQPLSDGLDTEREIVMDYTRSYDAREGLRAFSERRGPMFLNR